MNSFSSQTRPTHPIEVSFTGTGKGPASRLSLGTASFRLKEKERCFRVLEAFLEAGGHLIDTGRSYGESEAVIGRWLATSGKREKVFLITKCGHGANGIFPDTDVPKMVETELSESLKSLGAETIDIYMPHRDNRDVPVPVIMDALHRAVSSGKVRLLGASNWTPERFDEANRYAERQGRSPLSILSNHLSLAQAAEPFYNNLVTVDQAEEDWHEAGGPPLLSWSSQARGFFTGRYQNRTEGDPFSQRMMAVYGSTENLARLQRAGELGRQKGGYSAVQIALAWLLHKPFPVIPIVGPRTPQEVISCSDATGIILSHEDVSFLEGRTTAAD